MARAQTGYAYNHTRQAFLATAVLIAETHWTRLVGLMGTRRDQFRFGNGLWIVPCHGVHTFAMRFPIDVIYLDREQHVHHIEENVKPWRITPVHIDCVSVLELPAHTVWNTATELGDRLEIGLGLPKGAAA
jgi:uncharacterized membrane protein (UPF0127 family)